MRIAVTGAFGYSGRCITKRLLEAGHDVITLTNSLHRPNPFGEKVTAFAFHFEEPHKLRDALRGVHTLVNTFKALGLSYCILRPTVLFGKEDVLINNIAWSLRHLPVVGVFGAGDYRLQPIYVDDLARAAAERVSHDRDEVLEAIGPEIFTYRELVARVATGIGMKPRIISVPPGLGYWACRTVGLFVGDVVITREEIRGLMEGRLYVDAPPLGATKLTEWIDQHRDTLGRRYTSEMARRVDRTSEYESN